MLVFVTKHINPSFIVSPNVLAIHPIQTVRWVFSSITGITSVSSAWLLASIPVPYYCHQLRTINRTTQPPLPKPPLSQCYHPITSYRRHNYPALTTKPPPTKATPVPLLPSSHLISPRLPPSHPYPPLIPPYHMWLLTCLPWHWSGYIVRAVEEASDAYQLIVSSQWELLSC